MTPLMIASLSLGRSEAIPDTESSGSGDTEEGEGSATIVTDLLGHGAEIDAKTDLTGWCLPLMLPQLKNCENRF